MTNYVSRHYYYDAQGALYDRGRIESAQSRHRWMGAHPVNYVCDFLLLGTTPAGFNWIPMNSPPPIGPRGLGPGSRPIRNRSANWEPGEESLQVVRLGVKVASG
jgi:hypothetical protein